jgi:glutamine amidotransferase
MQLLFEVGKEHGTHEGLGLLPGRVVHFHAAAGDGSEHRAGAAGDGAAGGLTVPHMGWNTLDPTRASDLLADLPGEGYVYFVHSYHALPAREADVLATTTYGHAFPSVVQREHVYGVQFHPEKSQAVGLKILSNFAARVGA